MMHDTESEEKNSSKNNDVAVRDDKHNELASKLDDDGDGISADALAEGKDETEARKGPAGTCSIIQESSVSSSVAATMPEQETVILEKDEELLFSEKHHSSNQMTEQDSKDNGNSETLVNDFLVEDKASAKSDRSVTGIDADTEALASSPPPLLSRHDNVNSASSRPGAVSVRDGERQARPFVAPQAICVPEPEPTLAPTATAAPSTAAPDEENLIEAELVPETSVVDAVPAPPSKRLIYISIIASLVLAVVIVSAVLVPTAVRSSTSSDEGEEETGTYTDLLQIGNTIIGSAPGDRFGAPLALSASGTTLAVGARENGALGEDSGLVRVFQLMMRRPILEAETSPGNEPESDWVLVQLPLTDASVSGSLVWRQRGNSISGEAAGDQFAFSGMSMSSDGSRIAVGAPYHSAGGLLDAGNIRVFDYLESNRTWSQVGPAVDGTAAGDVFGRAVAMSADGKIFGGSAYESSENGEYSGHVRVFQQATNETDGSIYWKQLGNTMLGKDSFDRLGRALDMSADGLRIAAGATEFIKGGGPGTGFVQVYDYNGTDWNQVGQDIYGDNDQDVFGRDVALSSDGTVLACGANLGDNNGEDSGYARIYKLSNDGGSYYWQQMGATIVGATIGDGLGNTIALSSDGFRVAVGATQKETSVGYVQVLEYDVVNDEWDQVDENLQGSAMLDKFGGSVQLSDDGHVLAVGAIASDANGEDSGHVQIFEYF